MFYFIFEAIRRYAMIIYKRRPKRTHIQWGRLSQRIIEYTIKSILIACVPLPISILVGWTWAAYIYGNDLPFSPEMRELLAAAWIPVFGVVYGLFTGGIFALVFSQYMEMRVATKERHKEDSLERFMRYADEELSPLWHGVAFVLAVAVLAGFAVYTYPDALTGALVMGAATYVFALLCFIVIEMDEPRYGFFVIKSIPEEWLKKDPHEWRLEQTEQARITVTKTTTVELSPAT